MKTELDPIFDYRDGERNLIRETFLVILVGFMMFLLMVFAIGFGEEIDAFFTWIVGHIILNGFRDIWMLSVVPIIIVSSSILFWYNRVKRKPLAYFHLLIVIVNLYLFFTYLMGKLL